MPRPATGPRRIDSSGTWYAVKVINGKRHTISLGTKIKAEAHRKWPAAQAQLEAMATPQKLKAGGTSAITLLDNKGNPIGEDWDWNENISQTQEEEDPSLITWARAEDVAARRYMRRKGKEVSRSWRYQIKNARRHMPVKYPLDVTTKDVRQMVDKMEEQGFAASTIAQRTSALSGLLESLIKGGYTEDDWVNPFDRVDTHGISTKSFYKAQPSDYRWIAEVPPGIDRTTLEIIAFTGVRINEAVSATYKNDNYLYVPEEVAKNRASIRDVPLPPHLQGRLTRSTSNDSFRRFFNRYRPHDELTPHSFRHGFKTAARDAKADELTVERLLGHALGKMQMVYGEYPLDLLEREAKKVWNVIDSWIN
jgi:integrase